LFKTAVILLAFSREESWENETADGVVALSGGKTGVYNR
jgi:hypothetical protein